MVAQAIHHISHTARDYSTAQSKPAVRMLMFRPCQEYRTLTLPKYQTPHLAGASAPGWSTFTGGSEHVGPHVFFYSTTPRLGGPPSRMQTTNKVVALSHSLVVVLGDGCSRPDMQRHVVAAFLMLLPLVAAESEPAGSQKTRHGGRPTLSPPRHH